MTFREVFFVLSMKHDQLWLKAPGEINELAFCDLWKSADIRSTGGRILASQIGHPDEWELSPICEIPDTGLIIDEPDGCAQITDSFYSLVKLHMATSVHPHIEHGRYVPPIEN